MEERRPGDRTIHIRNVNLETVETLQNLYDSLDVGDTLTGDIGDYAGQTDLKKVIDFAKSVGSKVTFPIKYTWCIVKIEKKDV